MLEKKVLELARRDETALTFDEVRLRTAHSEVMPNFVDVSSRFSRNVGLKVPIVSAAMDTVTEYTMAIELAKLGGIGVIHKAMSAQEQAAQVARVKHHLNGKIERPICVQPDEKISTILNRRSEKGYAFHSFPVINDEGKLVGIITQNDFDFCDDPSLTAKEIMSRNVLFARKTTTIREAYQTMKREKRKVLPLVNENGQVEGMYVFSDVRRIINGGAINYNLDDKERLRVAAAIGTGEEALKRASELIAKEVDVLVIDTAHGDSRRVIDTLTELKRSYKIDIVTGNVSIGESARRLVDEGADGIKVGQGPGSICTTRIVAGVGRPQVSAIYDCAREILGTEIPICADGGLRNSGDITIAIAAGAHSVMMGSMLAGTEESPGKTVFAEGTTWKTYRGMGSIGAMQESEGARERYSQSGKDVLVPEGVEGRVKHKGPLANVIHQYVGGLRSGMGYTGSKTIEELRERGNFDRITPAGLAESHPHDVTITHEAPNYQGVK